MAMHKIRFAALVALILVGSAAAGPSTWPDISAPRLVATCNTSASLNDTACSHPFPAPANDTNGTLVYNQYYNFTSQAPLVFSGFPTDYPRNTTYDYVVGIVDNVAAIVNLLQSIKKAPSTVDGNKVFAEHVGPFTVASQNASVPKGDGSFVTFYFQSASSNQTSGFERLQMTLGHSFTPSPMSPPPSSPTNSSAPSPTPSPVPSPVPSPQPSPTPSPTPTPPASPPAGSSAMAHFSWALLGAAMMLAALLSPSMQ